jgi:hypothetical protein
VTLEFLDQQRVKVVERENLYIHRQENRTWVETHAMSDNVIVSYVDRDLQSEVKQVLAMHYLPFDPFVRIPECHFDLSSEK